MGLKQTWMSDLDVSMVTDKSKVTGQTLGRAFNYSNGNINTIHLCKYEAKLANLKLKTWPKQLLGSLLLNTPLPGMVCN